MSSESAATSALGPRCRSDARFRIAAGRGFDPGSDLEFDIDLESNCDFETNCDFESDLALDLEESGQSSGPGCLDLPSIADQEEFRAAASGRVRRPFRVSRHVFRRSPFQVQSPCFSPRVDSSSRAPCSDPC